MTRIEALIEEIGRLLEEGVQLVDPGDNRALLASRYERWYTQALLIVSRIIPEREADFRELYKLDRRKEITAETYSISDFLLDVDVEQDGEAMFDPASIYGSKLILQVAILRAAREIALSVFGDISAELHAELIDDGLEAARELMQAGQLRSAGVVCGVVLESHLKSVADRHSIKLRKKRPDISDWNEALRENTLYDVPMWRLLQRLADIWEMCAHAQDQDPERADVEDLIAGTRKVTREVF